MARASLCRGMAVVVTCTDLHRSEQFYRHVLGAVPDPREGHGCPWFMLGDMSISLLPNATEPADTSPPRAALCLSLEVDDLDAACRRFEENDVKILQPSDGQFVVIADPDGIVIEVWEAPAP